MAKRGQSWLWTAALVLLFIVSAAVSLVLMYLVAKATSSDAWTLGDRWWRVGLAGLSGFGVWFLIYPFIMAFWRLRRGVPVWGR